MNKANPRPTNYLAEVSWAHWKWAQLVHKGTALPISPHLIGPWYTFPFHLRYVTLTPLCLSICTSLPLEFPYLSYLFCSINHLYVFSFFILDLTLGLIFIHLKSFSDQDVFNSRFSLIIRSVLNSLTEVWIVLLIVDMQLLDIYLKQLILSFTYYDEFAVFSLVFVEFLCVYVRI